MLISDFDFDLPEDGTGPVEKQTGQTSLLK
jgi:hypothetical protein